MKKKIGIVGGGQLGRMLTIEAKDMGFDVYVLDPTPHCPAAQVGAKQLTGSLEDENLLKKLSESVDFMTFEIEHIDAKTLKALEEIGKSVHPSPYSLEVIKDKLAQKRFLQKNEIPTAPFYEVKSIEEIQEIAKKIGYPFLLKSRFGGYDGKGNFVVADKNDIAKGLELLGSEKIYIEEYVPFEKELAVIVSRGSDGMIHSYPVVETIHKDNILHFTLAPAPIDTQLQENARKLARQVLKHIGGYGVFGIEMFLTKDGQILINEIAPRVHNSGHYTIEACHTSQFKQHILAITEQILEDPSMKVRASVMVNILGDRNGKANPQGISKVKKLPGTTIHIYGKLETKPDRKMGHITVVGDDLKKCLNIAKEARELVTI